MEIYVNFWFGKNGGISITSGEPAEATKQVRRNMESGLADMLDGKEGELEIKAIAPTSSFVQILKAASLDELEDKIFEAAVLLAEATKKVYRPSETVKEELDDKAYEVDRNESYYGSDSIEYHWAIEELYELDYELRVMKEVERRRAK